MLIKIFKLLVVVIWKFNDFGITIFQRNKSPNNKEN